MISRLLMLAGAAGVAAATFMPWITVQGNVPRLDVLGTNLTGKTVSGSETDALPVLLAVGGVVAVLAALNKLRRLVLLFGVLVTLAGAGLIYYAFNLVDIEFDGPQQLLAETATSSSVEVGPIVLLGSGALIMMGALRR